MEHIPTWWPFLLLLTAGYRLWRLAAEDSILDRPRAWFFNMQGWESGPPPPGFRSKLAEFVRCPWCLGFWIVLCLWFLWLTWPTATLVAATPFALSVGVGALARYFE